MSPGDDEKVWDPDSSRKKARVSRVKEWCTDYLLPVLLILEKVGFQVSWLRSWHVGVYKICTVRNVSLKIVSPFLSSVP